jgi:transposase InsO family protein
VVLALVEELAQDFGIDPVLRVIEEPPSTYYRRLWRRDHPSDRQVRDEQLTAKIREIYKDSDDIYGAPRVHAMLVREGETVGRRRVERLMRASGLVGVSPARQVSTTVRNPEDPLSEDLVKRDFTADAPDRLWVTDLTEIATGQGKLYLAAIRDAFSRKIVAWRTSPVADHDLVCGVLEQALVSRRPPADDSLIHHADHGTQYTSIKLTSRLLAHGIRASMGTVGDSLDNALAENMWSLIKTECLRRKGPFETFEQVDMALLLFIDGFYNPRRIQKRLGWLSPDEYEAAWHAARDRQDPDHVPGAADGTASEGSSWVGQPDPSGGAGPAETAGAPSGVAGADGTKPPITKRHDPGGSRRRPSPTPPREGRGRGQRPGVLLDASAVHTVSPTRPTTSRRTPKSATGP